MAEHQHISTALQEVITDLVYRALAAGKPPPPDVFGDLLVFVRHDDCSLCGEPVVIGPSAWGTPSPLHLDTGKQNCSVTQRWAADVGAVIDELLSSGLLTVETLAQVIACKRVTTDPEDIKIEVHGAVITLEMPSD